MIGVLVRIGSSFSARSYAIFGARGKWVGVLLGEPGCMPPPPCVFVDGSLRPPDFSGQPISYYPGARRSACGMCAREIIPWGCVFGDGNWGGGFE